MVDSKGTAEPSSAVKQPKGLPGFLRRTLRNPTDDDSKGNRGRSGAGEKGSGDNVEGRRTLPSLNILPKKLGAKLMNKESDRKQSSEAGGKKDSKAEETENGEEAITASDAKSYKEITFEKTIAAPIVNMRELRRLGWNGIPAKYRAQSWKILLGYLPANAGRREATLLRKRQEYRDAIAQHYDTADDTRTLEEQETLRQVLVDVPRTSPDVGLFRNQRIRKCMGRLLYIWAMRHPASSYVQGINDLTTPLFSVFLSEYFGGRDMTTGEIMDQVTENVMSEVEADTYWCLTNLLAGIQDHYTCDQPGVQRMVMRLEELIQRIDAELCAHFRNTGIEFMQFAFKWMNCLLLREFTLHSVIRLWDTYFSEGDGGFEDFHVYVCAAFLCQYSNELKEMEFDELFGFMQNMPTADWGDAEVEVLLSQAFVLSTLFGGSDAHLTSAAKPAPKRHSIGF
mmetsp:Transcript_16299/g.20286  ORF Transcript_16299/g.20286 Transcript_16299/m.20286 type:complete len:453 (-) Transcript_16299:271-1629(-)